MRTHIPLMRPAAAGFSLIEFMIAITVSMIVLAALSATFVANSRARTEMERSNQQIENGRYALQVLGDDFQLAGYLSQFNLNNAAIPTPGSKPDPCTTTLANLVTALPMHIQGYDGAAPGTCTSLLTGYKTGTDVVVIRRVSTCVRGSANCAAVAGAPYFQASLCSAGNELGSLTGAGVDWYRLDTNIANLNRTKRDCSPANLADMRQYLVHIYYIASNDQGTDGIPTLKRVELTATGGAIAFSAPVPLADGIENMQLEYGIDTSGDGAPDAFTADPDSYNGCAGAACVLNWRNVMSVKINLLARNTSQSRDFTDSHNYVLGLKADGSPNAVAASNDHYKRHAYEATVRLQNPSARRET